MECPDFDVKIHLPLHTSPDKPLDLFSLYYTLKLLKSIVLHTNSYSKEPRDPTKSKSRALAWFPTSLPKIYTYIIVFPLNKIKDY